MLLHVVGRFLPSLLACDAVLEFLLNVDDDFAVVVVVVALLSFEHRRRASKVFAATRKQQACEIFSSEVSCDHVKRWIEEKLPPSQFTQRHLSEPINIRLNVPADKFAKSVG